MSKFKHALCAGTAAFFLSAGISTAATFDFVSMADDSNDDNWIGAVEKNWGDVFGSGLMIGGITLNASGSNGDKTFADAFFDKGNAGLGVCSTVHATPGSSGCATGIGSRTWDDNVQGNAGGETLTLDFGQAIDFTNILFNDDGHVALNGTLNVNGQVLNVVGGAVTSGFEYLKGASVYNFSYTSNQFYLASATVGGSGTLSTVPLPASGLLLFGALGGMSFMRRKRKAV